MRALVPSTAVGKLVIERPNRARVFERYGIDYFCDGKRSLEETCIAKGLRLDDVLGELEDATDADDATDAYWLSCPVEELVDHIVTTHHAYLRAELPRLESFVDKVVAGHGDCHPELKGLRLVFAAFQQEMLGHMQTEEEILFPMIQPSRSERPPRASRPAEEARGDNIRRIIYEVELEHEGAVEALACMRELTSGFRPPPDACDCHRILLQSLEVLEEDVHLHIHKENNILFPRVTAVEIPSALSGR